MKLTEHLLLALPASGNYPGVVDYAIQLTQKLSAKITVALIYTCNEELVGQVAQNQKAFEAQKKEAKEQFQQLRARFQQMSLDYRLVSIDGPFSNAVVVASHSYHPDVIITVPDRQIALNQLIWQVPNHLLLVPSNYHYCPIRLVALAHNPKAFPNPQLIDFISQFVKNNQATLEVIEFGQECLIESPFSLRANAELDYLFRNTAHRFYLEECQNELAGCISRYIHDHKVDVVMISSRSSRYFNSEDQNQPIVDTVLQCDIPIMILK
jgi:hypothetical protein